MGSQPVAPPRNLVKVLHLPLFFRVWPGGVPLLRPRSRCVLAGESDAGLVVCCGLGEACPVVGLHLLIELAVGVVHLRLTVGDPGKVCQPKVEVVPYRVRINLNAGTRRAVRTLKLLDLQAAGNEDGLAYL